MMVTTMLYLTLTMNYLTLTIVCRFPINTQLTLMAENVTAPLGNFASLSYLKEDSKLRLLIDVCTMFARALVSGSL